MWLAQRTAAERRRNVEQRRSKVEANTIRNLTPQHPKLHPKGLDARERPLSAAEGKVFSLDIPFYRTDLSSLRHSHVISWPRIIEGRPFRGSLQLL
jgi:hypothetical protein